jgi:hypothetical protein
MPRIHFLAGHMTLPILMGTTLMIMILFVVKQRFHLSAAGSVAHAPEVAKYEHNNTSKGGPHLPMTFSSFGFTCLPNGPSSPWPAKFTNCN